MKTKKSIKKIAGAATAAVIVSCAMVPLAVTNVSAASITINNKNDGHTYQAYQIFSGDLSGTGASAKLSNVEWGSGVDDEAAGFWTAVNGITEFAGLNKAADVADELSKGDSALANKLAEAIDDYLTTTFTASTDSGDTYTISLANPGYYLVKDATGSLNEKYDAHTDYIIQVLDDVPNVTPKSSLPEIKKYVQDVNDSLVDSSNYPTNYSDLQKTADYDIGDYVPFTLEGTIPKHYDSYDKYQYIITDELSAGLEIDQTPKDLEVFVNGTKITSGYDVAVNSVESGISTLKITISNLKTHLASYVADAKVVVKYKAKLDTDAVHGKAGNPNEVYLDYSNNPYSESELGRTPKDLVKVYTYKTIINKTDGTNPLGNAAFALYKKPSPTADENSWTKVKDIPASETTTSFEFTGLDDGQYKLVETDAPEGYNKLSAPIYFEITATHDTAITDDTSLSALSATQKSKTFGNLDTGVTPLAFTPDLTAGSLTASVENKAGSALPSTGGIGTTPFYVGGGVLAAAAGVYIIVRKRMKNHEE